QAGHVPGRPKWAPGAPLWRHRPWYRVRSPWHARSSPGDRADTAQRDGGAGGEFAGTMGNAAMTFLSRLGAFAAAFFFGTLGAALAAPENYMVDFQTPVAPVMERIKSFHDVLLVICVA